MVEALKARPRRHEFGTVPGSVDQSDRESAAEAWLLEYGLDEPWKLSASLANEGCKAETLSSNLSGPHPVQVSPVLRYLVASRNMFNLVHQVSIGAGRLSEIVKALNGYSHLDHAPVQDVRVHEGDRHTLIILGSKLKGGAKVRR